VRGVVWCNEIGYTVYSLCRFRCTVNEDLTYAFYTFITRTYGLLAPLAQNSACLLKILHQTRNDILSAGILWYFLSSFLIMIFLCLLIVGVESYCFTWSYSVPHTDSVGILWTSDRPVAETSTWQHTTLTRDRFPSFLWDSNPQPQLASSRRPTPYKARPPISVILWFVAQTRRFVSTSHFVSGTFFCAFVAAELMCHALTRTNTGALWWKTLQDNRRNLDSFSRRLSTKSYINAFPHISNWRVKF